MDIQALLDDHGVTYDMSGRGKNRPGWCNVRCPLCGKDPYLGINLARLYSFCWNCSYVPLPKALSLLTGLSEPECRQLIGKPTHERVRKSQHTGKLKLPAGLLDYLLPCQKDYLHGRGFDPKTLSALWGLRGIGPLGGHLAWRIFIPVHQHGKIVTWTTRRITNQEPRYHSAKPQDSDEPIERCAYGGDFVRLALVLVEGPADAWRIGPGAVGLLGLRVSTTQLRWLSTVPNRTVCFDSEREAQERARRLVRELSVFPGTTTNVVLESGKDAGCASDSEIQELRRRFL